MPGRHHLDQGEPAWRRRWWPPVAMMHALSAVAPSVASQCGRRVPARAPLHCGLTRAEAASSGRSAPTPPRARAAPADSRRGTIVITLLAAAAASLALYAAIRRVDQSVQGAARTESPLARGQAIYPALPALPMTAARTAPRGVAKPMAGVTQVPLRPPSAAEADWDRAVALLDLPLRRIAAETSVLELSYRPFAAACVAVSEPTSAGTGGDGEWLASLRTAPLLPGVTLRENGATVDCEGARRLLVARADVLNPSSTRAALGRRRCAPRTLAAAGGGLSPGGLGPLLRSQGRRRQRSM